jgi:hypothetical protein
MDRSEYPRVTEIVRPYGPDFSHVSDLDFYADRGDRVHHACSTIARGLFAPIDRDITGYIASFRRFFATVDRIFVIEQRLHSGKWKFTGQPDLVCTLKHDPRVIIVDYKSAVSYHRVWDLQTGGYKVLVEENYDLKVERWGTLRLRQDGSRPLFKDAGAGSVVAFLGLLQAHHYMHGIAA